MNSVFAACKLVWEMRWSALLRSLFIGGVMFPLLKFGSFRFEVFTVPFISWTVRPYDLCLWFFTAILIWHWLKLLEIKSGNTYGVETRRYLPNWKFVAILFCIFAVSTKVGQMVWMQFQPYVKSVLGASGPSATTMLYSAVLALFQNVAFFFGVAVGIAVIVMRRSILVVFSEWRQILLPLGGLALLFGLFDFFVNYSGRLSGNPVLSITEHGLHTAMMLPIIWLFDLFGAEMGWGMMIYFFALPLTWSLFNLLVAIGVLFKATIVFVLLEQNIVHSSTNDEVLGNS